MKFNDIVQEIAFKSPVKMKDGPETNLKFFFDDGPEELNASFGSANPPSM